MKTKTVFLGLMLAFCLASLAVAYSIDDLIRQLRPDYFLLSSIIIQPVNDSCNNHSAYSLTTGEFIGCWPVTTVMTSTTTTTTTLPSFTLGNQTITYNLSWCANLTQVSQDDYAFLYQDHKVDLNASTVGNILEADLQNCTRIIRARADLNFIPLCNNSNPTHVWGVNCKYGTASCISYGEACGSDTIRYWNGCMRG